MPAGHYPRLLAHIMTASQRHAQIRRVRIMQIWIFQAFLPDIVTAASADHLRHTRALQAHHLHGLGILHARQEKQIAVAHVSTIALQLAIQTHAMAVHHVLLAQSQLPIAQITMNAGPWQDSIIAAPGQLVCRLAILFMSILIPAQYHPDTLMTEQIPHSIIPTALLAAQ